MFGLGGLLFFWDFEVTENGKGEVVGGWGERKGIFYKLVLVLDYCLWVIFGFFEVWEGFGK